MSTSVLFFNIKNYSLNKNCKWYQIFKITLLIPLNRYRSKTLYNYYCSKFYSIFIWDITILITNKQINIIQIIIQNNQYAYKYRRFLLNSNFWILMVPLKSYDSISYFFTIQVNDPLKPRLLKNRNSGF